MALLPPVRIHERGSDRGNGYRDYVPQWVDRSEEEGSSGRMEEDTELEEGEAFEGGGSGSGSGDDDLERLSYLDTRLESVLGDCQKEFQGNLSTERLGSRYGGYGSFLPSTIRAAPVLGAGPPPQSGSEPARPRPSDGHVGALRPRPNEGAMERARRGQGGGVVAADPSSWSKEREHRKKNVRSINAMVKAQAPGATNSAKETAPAEKKSLTIKLTLPPKAGYGVDKQAQNSVYNKFGLDHPSSASEDDLEDDDRSGSEDNASPDLSPPGMIRVMTAFEHPHGGMISPGIPALVALEPSERKEISKQMMNTPVSKTDGVQGSRKVAVMETLNKLGKETKTKHKEVTAPADLTKIAPAVDLLKSSKKEIKEGSLNTLKVSYKHPGREDLVPQNKPPPEPKRKGKESSKEYSALKEPKDKFRDVKENSKEGKKDIDRKELVPKVSAEMVKEGPKESFKVTLKDLPPSKEHMKPGPRDSLDFLKDVVKAGKKVNKKAGKEPTRSHSKDSEKEKGVDKDLAPLGGDLNGLQAPPPQAPYPAVGTSNLDVAGAVIGAPQIVLDNWVECTKCGQWRLCVPGINVNGLPENWQCRAMTWLPGLNSCKYTEEITTGAVYNYLGLQNPNTVPAAGLPGVPYAPVLPAPLPPADPALATRHLEPKPSKAQKPSSKKGVAKKVGGTTPKIPAPVVKKVDMGSVKNKSLSDVGQPPDRGPPQPSEDPGYQRVMADKQKFKEKEKLKRMRASEGEDTRPQKQAMREDERNKVPGGVKRKKKTELSQDNEETHVVKKSKGADSLGRKTGAEMLIQSKGQSSDENTHSLHYGSDDAGISSRTAGRSSLPAQAPKKVKVTLSGNKEPKKKDDRLEVKGDDRKRKDTQRAANVRCKPEYVEKHESSDSDEDKYRKDDCRKSFRESDTNRRVDSRGRNGYLDGKKRVKEEGESEYHSGKRRMVSKDLESARDSETGLSPKSQRDWNNERRPNGDLRDKRLFDEVSGIARTYVQGSFGDRADDSPHDHSPAPPYSQDQRQMSDEKRGQRSRSHSPSTASSSKPSYSRGSSASGSKGPSAIESTVSSSPLRSLKAETGVGSRRVTESVQVNDRTHTADSHPTSNKQSPVSPCPKRSADDPDTQSDRDRQTRQTHRGWDDRGLHSPEPERDTKGSGRDGNNNRDTSSGRDRYVRSTSREGQADFRKYDGKSRGPGKDEDRHWDEGGSRERRAGSANHFGNGDRGGSYDRHREERHRERDDRYERRGDDRFRDRDRDRDRDRERPREIWTSDRGGDTREERSTRERSVHGREDWSGRPSSRESRPDKQGGMNWRDDSRPGRDTSREGRERAQDGIADKVNVDSRSKHVDENTKDEHGEHEPVQGVQRDSSSHRYDVSESTPQKDSKFRLNPTLDRNGDRAGAGSAARKESEGAAIRSGTEPVNVSGGSSKIKPEGQPPGARKRGSSPATDIRQVDESDKHGKEPKNGAEGSYVQGVGADVGLTSNPGHIARFSEGGFSSPTKKTNHAALSTSLTKEAKTLKHSADRIKNLTGMEDASTNMYLQAGLKFLEGAHHQEAANERPGDFSVIFRIYLDTANLCDYCSSAFEKNKDHAAAALSYMVAAVARMRVLMFKSKDINKDCVELQHAVKASTALGSQVAAAQTPPIGLASVPQPNRASDKPGSSQPGAPVIGESPSSSSASDVDNFNNHAALSEKLALNASKGTALSPLPGTSAGTIEVLPSRLHSNYQRLLTNSGDVFRMLESWSKARIATAAYEAECAGDDTRQETILAIRRVGEIGLLDDMDALVKQVRVALDVIGH